MAKFNKGGQWSLDNDRSEQLFKSWPDHKKPEHPLSKPIKEGTGEDQVQEFSESDIATQIIDGFKQEGIRQPTDKEMFGKLVKSKEEINVIKAQERKLWEESLHAYVDWKPAQVIKKHKHDPESWGNGKPILDEDEREELRKNNREQIKGL